MRYRYLRQTLMTDFSPAWFLRNPHLQTVWGRMTRPRRLVDLRRETIDTPDGDELLLDHLEGGGEIHFVLLHGLEGSSNSVYMQGLLQVIERHGFSATVMNFRSCARDPLSVTRMIPNRRPRFYHSGETTDFDFAVRLLANRHPSKRIIGIGASLGGNVLLKWLGEHPGQEIVSAAVTLSVPYDLAAGAKYLDKPLARLYVSRFVKTLGPKIERLVEQFPDVGSRVDVVRARRARTFREFDDAATAPIHGFADAEDYWQKSSSIHYLDRITTPTLCISALDDPFLPPEVLPRARAAASPSVEFVVTERGGHVGFISGSAPWKLRYWAEELAVRWAADHACTAVEHRSIG